MAINLFLDANILLSFYALSNADIEQLKQLKNVVTRGEITLLLSEHLVKEVNRNREMKISESFKALRGDTFKCQAPSFVRSLKQFQDLRATLQNANQIHAELVNYVDDLVQKRMLDADGVIDELIEAAGVRSIEKKLYDLAHLRLLTGNPPGKKKSTMGDELNWEFLLAQVPDGEELHLVSADSDYSSPIDNKKINNYLYNEWKESKCSELHFYKDLTDFFELHVPKIKLANQAKLNALIAELSGSQSFADTHAIVAKFPENPDFNDAQILELSDIKLNNSQVGWIKDDQDVKNLYSHVDSRYAEILGGGKDAGT